MGEISEMRPRIWRSALAIGLATCLAQVGAHAQEASEQVTGPPSPWSFPVRAGVAHQFETGIDGGGDFSVNRLFIEPGVQRFIGTTASVGFTLGLGYDGYDFSGGFSPWSDVQTVNLSAPLRWRMDESWTLFGIPSLRFNAEQGADLGDGMTGGVLAGFAYRFSDTLTLGPGLGVITQIEDRTQFFPIILIDWKITDALTLRTGRGFAATLGPGLALEWRPIQRWSFSLLGRYDRTRFRLDDGGVAPGGVGEDQSFGLFGSVDYDFGKSTSLSLFGGLSLGGELHLEDANGTGISKSKYDTAGSLGLLFNTKF
jgi:hypothetical protein